MIYELDRTQHASTLLLLFGKGDKADVTDREISQARQQARAS
jgi:hypothetical protein